MQSSIHRHLVERGSNVNILKDSKFSESRKILEGKSKILREQGMGKKKQASNSLNEREEEILWSNNKLGDSNSTSLVLTLWFLSTQHFGLRGCQEHYSLHVEDIAFHYENNSEYIEFHEDPTILCQRALRPKERITNTKMFAVGGERLFKLYLSEASCRAEKFWKILLDP